MNYANRRVKHKGHEPCLLSAAVHLLLKPSPIRLGCRFPPLRFQAPRAQGTRTAGSFYSTRTAQGYLLIPWHKRVRFPPGLGSCKLTWVCRCVAARQASQSKSHVHLHPLYGRTCPGICLDGCQVSRQRRRARVSVKHIRMKGYGAFLTYPFLKRTARYIGLFFCCCASEPSGEGDMLGGCARAGIPFLFPFLCPLLPLEKQARYA